MVSRKTISILGDRWPQTAKQEVSKINKTFLPVYKYNYGKNVMSAEMLEMSLIGVGTMLRLERDAWSMVK